MKKAWDWIKHRPKWAAAIGAAIGLSLWATYLIFVANRDDGEWRRAVKEADDAHKDYEQALASVEKGDAQRKVNIDEAYEARIKLVTDKRAAMFEKATASEIELERVIDKAWGAWKNRGRR